MKSYFGPFSDQPDNRRGFLRQSASMTGIAGSLGGVSGRAAAYSKSTVRIGLIADVHKDIIHDADERLTDFIRTMTAAKADAIIQLGDFCIPKPSNLPFLDIFKRFEGPQFHVLGNHDTDGGFTRE